MKSDIINVLLVDDHRIFRDGIVSMFDGSEDIEITGLASSGDEALKMILKINPDVMILDLSMPGKGGLEVLKNIQKLDQKPEVLVLSMHSDIEFVKETVSAGARGYVCKEDTNKEELINAIKAVFAKQTYFGSTVKKFMQQQFVDNIAGDANKNNISPGLETLSKREREILKMVMEGMSNQEIADSSFVSIRTVETHKSNIMTKLNLKNTVELVKYAIKNRFFDL